MCLRAVEPRVEQVRPEPAERGMEVSGSGLEQFHHRRIEADGDGAGHLEDQPGARRRTTPRLAGAVAMPRAVHPQVRPKLEPTVEPDQEILAARLDGIDAMTDHAMDLRDRTRAVRACRGHLPPEQERAQAGGGAEERVAFRHDRAG